MWINPKRDVHVSTFQLLLPDGTPTEVLQTSAHFQSLTETQLLEMYRWMVLARLFDERALKLQRQGRIGTYAPFSGQEAAQVGSAYALDPQDWVFPSYRELPVVWVRGMSLEQSLLYTMGSVTGGYISPEVNSFPVQIIIAAQTLHAMGSAWASKYLEDTAVNVCYIGDGATSQGDFHEALNFASVYHLPVIFFIQNNQWAISVPRSRQTASRTFAQKAIAYDIPGIQVDGNDVLAVYQVMREAVETVRGGGGPVLIEAVTYRAGPHTTSDDPTRYRSQEEVEAWRQRDPISRFSSFLQHRGLLDEAWDQAIREEAAGQIEQAVAAAEATPKGTLTEAMDRVYQTAPPMLAQQRAEAETFLAMKSARKGE